MNLLRKPVLLLSAANEPICILTARRSLTLLTKGKISVILHSDRQVYPGVFLPSVVRLLEYKYIPIRMQIVSRKNIMTRDSNTCQYCGVKFHPSELELEHIVPRSRGGKSSWDNLVAACRTCNSRKDNRTPEEAGMPLLHRPLPITIHTSRQLLRTVGSEIAEWKPWLWHDSEGDKRYQFN